MLEKTLLDVLQELSQLGYTEHVYRNAQGVICFQSQPLNYEKIELYEIVYDEQDTLIVIFMVDSICGNIKGVLVE